MRRFQDKTIIIIILIAVALLTVGYSALAYTLSLGGTAHFRTFWDVYFDNAHALEGSVQPDSAVTIDATNPLKVNYSVSFSNITDYYEFSVDLVNSGTMDAMIDSIVPLANGNSFDNLPNYLDYSIAYDDTCGIEAKQLLSAGETETIIFRVGVKEGTTASDIPSPVSPIPFSLEIVFAVADNTAVEVDRPFVYNVLRREVDNEGLAIEYTGTHKDSFTVNGNKKIYHWYADNATDGAEVLNKNNVILGGVCWQILRTTDTGGVKLIYNGEEENGECQTTRGTHFGTKTSSIIDLDGDYYYADDYTYDSTNNLFTLSGTKTSIHWSDSTYTGTIHKYTCLSNDPDATCSTLYLITSYYSSTKGNVIGFNTNVPYYSIGSGTFNDDPDSPSKAGYMYHKDYEPITQNNSTSLSIYTSRTGVSNSSVYVSTGISYNDATNQYTLVNVDESAVTRVTWKDSYKNNVNKYTCLKYADTTCDSVYYIVSTALNGVYYVELSNGQLLNDVNTNMYFATSYEGNTLVNPVSVGKVDWAGSHSYAGYYFCSDYTETTCSGPVLAVRTAAATSISYYSSENSVLFGTDVSYDDVNDVYTLSGDTKEIWNFGRNSDVILNYHYTCYNTTGTCSEVRYVIEQNFNSMGYYNYIILDDEENIEAVADELFFGDNINVNDSDAKFLIDEWYRKYFISNSSYLEDVIYCGDRSISSLGFLNPSNNVGGVASLQFNSRLGDTGLLCPNETDQFSVSNSKAHLTYPIALPSLPELAILGDNSIRGVGEVYYTMTPDGYTSAIDIKTIRPDGSYLNSQTSGGIAYALRPVISLKPGVKYVSGDGSKTTPYRIN
ncbi:MAG: hypothetical protein IJG68_07460 [Bacilli bacterium]|nr:hypothetical protein [Bacilli bacterium]